MTEPAIRDPGPLARFEALIAREDTMSVIVQRVADGETLKGIARSWEVPYGKLSEWVIEDAGRAEQYARASKLWADTLARETIGIADGLSGENLTKGEVTAARIQIDTRLKLAGKLDRERYGDSSSVKLDVKDRAGLLGADRDQRMLETARSLLFMVHTAGQVAERQRSAALALPEPKDVTPPRGDDEGVI